MFRFNVFTGFYYYLSTRRNGTFLTFLRIEHGHDFLAILDVGPFCKLFGGGVDECSGGIKLVIQQLLYYISVTRKYRKGLLFWRFRRTHFSPTPVAMKVFCQSEVHNIDVTYIVALIYYCCHFNVWSISNANQHIFYSKTIYCNTLDIKSLALYFIIWSLLCFVLKII